MFALQSILSRALKSAGLLLVGAVLLGNIAFATVTVTPGSGGTSISADNAANATSPAWTTLGNIVITEGANGDFATNQTNATLILTAPAGWVFNAGVGSVTFAAAKDLSGVSMTVAAGIITVTFSTDGTGNKTDVLTISGIQVRASDGANVPGSAQIYRATGNAGTGTITGITTTANTNGSGGTNFGSLSQVVGAHARLVVTFPGETFTDGTTLAGSGNSGTVTTQTAGTSFNITAIRATDQFYNVVTAYTGAKTIAYAGPGGSASTYTTSVTFASGLSSTTLATTLTRAQTTTITATDGGLFGHASSNITVNAGAFTKMQVLIPGETADPGSSAGRSGSPTAQTAGSGFTATVNAVDAYWNLVSSTNTVAITTSDVNDTHPSNAALVGGTLGFTVTFTTEGSSNVTVTNVSDGTKTAHTSQTTTVNEGAFTKLQILLPGETAVPGSATGKTGTPTAQTAGTPFSVTVNSVDANWNPVTSTDNISITSSDANAVLPSNNTLVAGTQSFSVTLKTAGSYTVTATDVTDGGKSPNTSSSLTNNAGAFTKMQVLVPGEVADPGTATGKTAATPSAQTAGSGFTVTVNAVDAYWNVVSSTNTVSITTSDANDTHPANADLVAGTKNFTVTLKTAGTSTVTATNVTDGSKPADISPSISVNAGAFAKMQLLVPGETAAPGTASGKTGSPSAQTVGIGFSVTVNAVDANWNFVSGAPANTIAITTSDAGDTHPSPSALSSGTVNFTVTFATSGSSTVTATNSSDGTKTANTSPSITINPAGTGTVTPATGGSAISSDNYNTATWTTLTGPQYDEAQNGNVGTGTIVLNVPSGFIFDTGGTPPTILITGSATSTENINNTPTGNTIALTSISTTQITFTITEASNGSNNTATFQNVRVQPSAGAPLASGNLTVSGTATIAGVTGSTNFGTLTQVAGAMTKLLVTLPGQTFTSGSGNSGSVSEQTAGTPFNIVSITATDQYFNTVTSYSGAKTLAYTGPGGVPSYTTSVNFTSGASTTTLSTTLSKAEATTITVTDGGLYGNASSSLTVNAGAFTKMQLLVPGETADPGSATGKTGTPSAQTAGSGFTVTVNAVDANWNLVSSTNTVGIPTSDANDTHPSNAALVGGTKDFTVTFTTAGSSTVTATNISDGSKTANTSPAITVNAGGFAKMQLIVPGETAAPGTATGKTGTPTAQDAVTAFSVTVNAVDANWNLFTGAPGDNITLTSSDANATMPAPAPLSGGTVTFATVLLPTAGTATVTATNSSDGSKTADTSPSITIDAGSINKLQVLFPGETAAPGTATGKTGTPYSSTLGAPITFTVNAVDANWNPVSATNTIAITSSDGAATLPGNAALVGGTQNFNITFNTAGGQTATATSVSGPAVTAGTSASVTVANITLTPATGGGAISADNFGTGSWTTLTGPVYEEAASGDVGVGTIILNAPSGFIFDVGGTAPTVLITRTAGGGGDARNINGAATGTSAAITSITTTTITFTVTSASNSGVTNSLTWQDIRVRPTAGAPLASGNLTISGTSTISGVTGSTNFGTLTEVAGAQTKLVVTLPGETFTSGSGNSGSVTAQTAGTSFNITSLTATDQYFNTVTSYSGTKTIAYAGPGGSPTYTTSVDFTLGASTTTLATTLKKAEATTITATDGGSYGNASSSLTVNAGAFTKMQILVPGETAAPGTATGKTGTPSVQTAGSGFTVTVNAVDANWNLVSSTNTVSVTTSDANDSNPLNAALVGGTKDFTVTLVTGGSSNITTVNVSDGTKTQDVSPSITVNAGAFTKMQLIVPGETAAPGTVTGKTGSPTDRTAGTGFTVTVNAVDAYWNLVSSTNTVNISTDDANDTHPSDAALVAGTKDFTITFKTAGSSTITATNITDGTKTADTSPSITINAGAHAKMQILVPGETAAPGTASGKTGSPNTQTAGVLFNVTVNAVDANWNLVSSITDVVSLSSTDGSATLSGASALIGGTGTRNVTFSTNGSFTVTVSDDDNVGITDDTSPSITVDPAGTGTLTAATGGSAISADNAGGSYTTLTGPVYEMGNTLNITAGTLVLVPPSGFEFDPGGSDPTILITNTGGTGNNINNVADDATIASSSRDASQITFTFTSVTTGTRINTLTWQDIRVRPTTGPGIVSGNITLDVSSNGTIAGITEASTNLGTLTKVAGAVNKLVVTLDNETFTPGSGNTGTVNAKTAGTPFNITSITAADQHLNVVTTYSGVKTLAYSGPTGSGNSYTTSVSFTSGVSTTTLATTLTKAEATTITVTESGLYGLASSSLTINAGSFTKLQILVPGETAAAGTVSGKTGSPSAQVAGTPFNVTVNAVDANWNLVTSITDNIGITVSDVNATPPANNTLSGGTQTFAVTMKTAGTQTVTATDLTDGGKTPDTTPSITINPGAINKLQILVPGETAAPGTASGKTGTPGTQATGSPFTVTVNAVDANWNPVTSTDVVSITTTDPGDVHPANAALVAGTQDFTITFATAGTSTITASDVDVPAITANTSPSITIASVTITQATGGGAISADDFGTGAWTTLTGPLYGEALNGDAGTGTIILNVPSGFIFDIGGTAPTVLITRTAGGGADTRNINQVATGTSAAITSITTTQITFTITSASNGGVTNSLTWQNVRVRPTAGYPLASGNLTKTGTSTMTGVTAGVTNFGTLTETFGATSKLVITLPGETFTEGSGNSGTASEQVQNAPFNITSITATDQYFNIVTSYTYTGRAISYSGPAGVPSYTTSVDFTSGVSTTTLVTSLPTVEITTITADDASISGPASSSLTVNGVAKTWDDGGGDNNWNTAANWSPDGVPSSVNNVTLSGTYTINVNTAAATKNLTINDANIQLTILSGNSITVSGNYSQSNGTVNTEASFPTVSGTISISGGTFGYTAASGSQSISAQTYNNLTISGGGTKTALGSVTVSGNLSVGSGATLDDGGYQVIGNASGTITLSSTSTLILGSASTATNFPTNFVNGNISIDAASTVTYNSNQPQTIKVLNYGNLTSAGSGSRTFTSGQTVGIAGTFTPSTNTYVVTGSTINYNGSGSQTIAAFNYNHLTSSSTGARTLASSGTIGIAGTFTPGSNSYTNTSSTINFNGSGSQTIPAFNYNNLTSSSSGARTLASSGTIGVAGTFTKGTNSYTITSSTIDYNSTSAQNIAEFTYNNLTVSGSGTTSLTANVAVEGDLTISGGTMDLVTYTADRSTSGGTLTIAAACTLRIGGTGTIPANYTTHDFDPTSVIDFYGTAQTIPSGTYENFIVSSPGGTITLGANIIVTGNLTVSDGTLDLSTFTADRSTVGGTLTVSSTGTLRIGGTNTMPADYSTYTLDPASTVEYYGTAHTVAAVSYGNLLVTSSGAMTLASSGTIGISGTFTEGTGTYTITGSTIDFNGTGAQTVPAFDYNNITISNNRGGATVTMESGTITIEGAMTVTATNASYTVTGNTVEYTGGSAQTIAPFTYEYLTFTNAGLKTVSGTVNVNIDVFVNSSASLSVGATGILNVSGDLTNEGIIVNDGSITIN